LKFRAATYTPDAAFDFGLDLILAGLQSRLAANAAPGT
jgi:hypothetical protein